MTKRLPWLPALLAAACFLASFRLPRGPGPDLRGFGRLPALQNGRIKPLDTIARSSLLMILGKQEFRHDGRRISALEWLLDLMSGSERADQYKVFRIDDPDLGGLLGLAPSAQRSHSFAELSRSFGEIHKQAREAGAVEARRRSRFQAAVFNLDERLSLYQRLKNSLGIAQSEDFSREVDEYEATLGPGVRAVLAEHGRSPSKSNSKALTIITGFFSRYRMLAEIAYFKVLAPAPGENPDAWLNVGEGLLEALREGKVRPELKAYVALAGAWRRGDGAEFERRAAECLAWAESAAPRAARFAGYEQLFNQAAPFYQGLVLYLCALLLCFLSWLAWPKELGKAAFHLLVLAFAIHSFGLISRMILQGRPPVTNLYSSAIFVGWAGVLLGIVLERFHRRGIAQAVAAAIGFTTLIVAHHLASGGDTLEMMQAVLDSNFWLSTHVVAITIGYSSTFLAGALAHVYILRGLLSRTMSKETARSLSQMTYGIVCFALLFSFVGTILGGIWADQSWGRFWGWDPKENGALLIVLWNAAILHARWGGFIRGRGLMLMAVGGNVFTSLSWFGVNMLGIGLHSYGWTDKAFFWLAAFIASQLAVIGLGSLPARFWRGRAALDLRPVTPPA